MSTGQKKVLCLGDSFTVGTGLGKGKEADAFPYQLVARLRQENYQIGEPKLYAVDGDTTKHLLGALNTAEPLSNPDNPEANLGQFDLVILSIGINDLFRGHSLEDYAHHFAELLNRAIRFAKNDPARVVVLSIPAWDASPSVSDGSGLRFREGKYEAVRNNMNEIRIPVVNFVHTKDGYMVKESSYVHSRIQDAQRYNSKEGIANEIDKFNGAAKTIIDSKNRDHPERQIKFFDLTSLTRDLVMEREEKTQWFAADGIHYSKEMYEKWVSAILPEAKRILAN